MINIGVIGSGGIISKHIRHLADRTDAGITALCDVDPDRIQATRETYFEDKTVNGYATPEDMYNSETLEAVIITTPHMLHYGQAVQALEADCHVFLEKPMTTSSKDALQLATKPKHRGKWWLWGITPRAGRCFNIFVNRFAIKPGDHSRW